MILISADDTAFPITTAKTLFQNFTLSWLEVKLSFCVSVAYSVDKLVVIKQLQRWQTVCAFLILHLVAYSSFYHEKVIKAL